jgi:hypothetical protein
MAAGEDLARLKAENAQLRRLLALYRKVAAEAGVTLPADASEFEEFWRAVGAYIEQTTPEVLAPHDPDAS